MAYDMELADRVRNVLGRRRGLVEKEMFGGLSFLLDGKMCCGVLRDDLVIRAGPKHYEKSLNAPHARPMDFTGRALKGFVYVSAKGCKTDKALAQWIKLGIDCANSKGKTRR